MDFALARRNMVESQLRTNKVTGTKLIQALHRIPRERFVPIAKRHRSYFDESIEVAKNRWLMPPMPLARLIQESYPQDTDNVMVIGAGMGYSSALYGALTRSVFAVENDPDLVEEMGGALTDLALDNVVAVEASLADGYPKEGPYDIILMTGMIEYAPQTLLDQLNEGGRLMAVVGAPGDIGRATLFGKKNGMTSTRVLFDATIKPLPGFARTPAFVF
ncbi:MAG: protein-L-isoaspartate O-methyltransferase [Rhodospirillales bacterium]|jgi:protein-L-isoaspartate(D-aspartate) O-methyltransferase|uniref:protein-L-isoaspartate O-methyltransferase family protein n=1 Tax=Hwanghaeella sp. 1Z406 TaxID=3402811 RepID=UPI000C88FB3C|nr:protein-L-isoaspartate O-methyltransferase [Rhodospirillales bacterium]|tara:strand:+ start:49116 stop:49769 length:654 start_codon:yes stop_codon:yes gene_type:complete